MTWLRQLLDWQREAATRASSSTRCASTCPARRCTSSPPRATSSRCRPGRRRSTSPTRCTPRSGTSASARGSTASWCRWSRRSSNGDVIEIFTSKSETRRPDAGLAGLRQEPAGPHQDPAVLQQGAPRGGDRGRQGGDRQGDAQAGPAAAADARPPTALMTIARDLHLADVASLYAAVGEQPGVGAVGGAEAHGRRTAARRARSRTSPRPPSPTRPPRSPRGQQRPRGRGQGRHRRLDQAGPVLHARCPATRSSASSPAPAGSACTASDCANAEDLRAPAASGWSR